jgi:hypothetical protein
VTAWGRGCTGVEFPWDGFPLRLAREEEQERCFCLSYRQASQQLCNALLTFYQTLSKHDRPAEWFVSVTTAFLKALHQERLAHASLVRISATVWHFARWLHQQSYDERCSIEEWR